MARTSQTTQTPTLFKIAAVLTEPIIDGDVIDAGDVRLLIVNGSVSPITVTVETTASSEGLDLEDLITPVAAGETALIGPFPKRLFGQPAGAVESGANDEGRVYVDYSAVTDVDRAVVAG